MNIKRKIKDGKKCNYEGDAVKYRVSQKTPDFSDLLDIVFVMN